MTRSKIRTSGAEGLTLSSTDITIASGDLLFGTSAKGVTLGVTSSTAANTLGDYEEGSWTPVYEGDNGNPTVSYADQIARYTKVGRLVSVWAYIRVSSTSGGSGGLKVGGLPFTAANTNYIASTVGYATSWASNASPTRLLVRPNTTVVNAYRQNTSDPRSGMERVQIGNLASNCELYMASVYYT